MEIRFSDVIVPLDSDVVIVKDPTIVNMKAVRTFINTFMKDGLFYHINEKEIVFIPFHMVKSIHYNLIT